MLAVNEYRGVRGGGWPVAGANIERRASLQTRCPNQRTSDEVEAHRRNKRGRFRSRDRPATAGSPSSGRWQALTEPIDENGSGQVHAGLAEKYSSSWVDPVADHEKLAPPPNMAAFQPLSMAAGFRRLEIRAAEPPDQALRIRR